MQFKLQQMKGLICIITTLVLLHLTQAIAQNNQDAFLLEQGKSHSISFVPQQATRITYQLYSGHVLLKISSQKEVIVHSEQSVVQMELEGEHLNKNITIEVSNGPGVGVIYREIVEQYELLSIGESKMLSLELEQSRIIEIHPRKYSRLSIEKFEGIAIFTTNRCLSNQKEDCFYELQRVQPNKMERSVEYFPLEPCPNCLVLIKIQAKERTAILRLSLESQIYLLATVPSMALVKAKQVRSFKVYGQAAQKGKVICYSGQVKINSTVNLVPLLNGYYYEIPEGHNYSTPVELSIQGVQDVSYILVESPSQENPVEIRDGFPQTFSIKPNVTYIAKVDKQSAGKGNFVISAPSFFLKDLYVRFVHKELDLHYAVRPQLLFNVGQAAQNFQLDNSTGKIQLQIKNMGRQSGQLNISVSMDQVMTLPFGQRQSNILTHNQFNYYLIEGIVGSVLLTVNKCVDCHLQVGYGSELGSIVSEEVKDRVFKKQVTADEGYLFIKVTSNNYAFYSISVESSIVQEEPAYLQKSKMETYLTEPDAQLQLQFTAPKCGNNYCQNVKYYLIEGSNRHHVSSRAYCPNILFDFDQRTKDIIFETIQPKKVRNGVLSYIRPLKHRDWLLIAAQVDQEILSYDIVNSGQIREYNNMRWPFFYFALFITFAVFISFVLFMSLRRPKAQSDGYIRGATAASEEDM